jgi:hypothetical protein
MAQNYTNTKSVKERWPNLTIEQLAQGQNGINGNIYATTQRLYEALEGVIARLEALEARQPRIAGARKASKETTPVTRKMKDAKRYIKGIGGKQPPGCSLPGDLDG